MAKLTPSIKVNIFKQLNERKLPWQTTRFVVKENEYDWLGNGNFSEVYVMEEIDNPANKYAVKIIGFNENRRIHKSDIESYKKEPILQYGLASRCSAVVKIIDTEVVSIKFDDAGNVEDVRVDDSGVEKTGWLVLVMIKMEKLAPIIEQNFTGDYSFKIPALINADDKEILSLAIDIAEALETSHSMGIMHRDVKLENIFYDDISKTYKLGDFGIARITNQGSASTKGAGTLGYEAPEVEGGNDAKYSYQADIYSFGVTIYLLMNELKFPGSTGYHVNRSIQYNPDGIISNPEHGSDELKKVICSLIAFNPNDRPMGMSIVLDRLAEIYREKYGDRESHIIGKEHNKMRQEVEILKSNISRTVTEVKHIPEEVKEHKAAIGNIVAEVKPEPSNNSTKTTVVQEAVNSNAVSMSKTRNTKIYKGIMGSLFLVIGLLGFAMLFRENLIIVKTPMIMWSLIANLLVSVVACVMKGTKKKMPYLIYFVLFGFSIYVMVTGGLSWFYVLMTIGLIIGGVTEVFAINIAAALYILLCNLNDFSLIENLFVLNNVWIFFALALCGFLLAEQYDQQPDVFAIILGEDYASYFIGFLVLVAGIIMFLINLIPTITITELLMKMHFIYVGPILWVVQAVVGFIDRRLS